MRSALLVMLALLCAGCQSKPEPQPQPVPIIVIVRPAPAPTPAKHKPEVLDFYTTWCGPCQKAAPKINQLEREGFKVTRIDCDKDTVTTGRYNIDSYPTFVVLVDGKEVFRTHSTNALRQYLHGGSKFPRL